MKTRYKLQDRVQNQTKHIFRICRKVNEEERHLIKNNNSKHCLSLKIHIHKRYVVVRWRPPKYTFCSNGNYETRQFHSSLDFGGNYIEVKLMLYAVL